MKTTGAWTPRITAGLASGWRAEITRPTLIPPNPPVPPSPFSRLVDMRFSRARRLLAIAFLCVGWPTARVSAQTQQAAVPSRDPRGLASDAEVLAIIKQRVEEKRSAGIVVGLLEPTGQTRIVAYGDP